MHTLPKCTLMRNSDIFPRGVHLEGLAVKMLAESEIFRHLPNPKLFRHCFLKSEIPKCRMCRNAECLYLVKIHKNKIFFVIIKNKFSNVNMSIMILTYLNLTHSFVVSFTMLFIDSRFS